MDSVIKFLVDYRGRLTDDAHFDTAGSIVDRYSLSTCLLLVEAGVAEWVVQEIESAELELPEFEPEAELPTIAATKPKRGRPKVK